MKGKWANLLAIILVYPMVTFADDRPTPEFLELLGQFQAMEELGVDVQQLIEQRLQTEPNSDVSAESSEQEPDQ